MKITIERADPQHVGVNIEGFAFDTLEQAIKFTRAVEEAWSKLNGGERMNGGVLRVKKPKMVKSLRLMK